MQTIKLSTTPGVVNPGAYLSQYDVGRQMLFLLYDDVGKYIPAAGSTVHIRATKPSGFGFDVACIWSQNSVTVTVTDEMSNESGSFAAELRITKDDAVLGTANFLWNVERSTHLNGTVDGNAEAKGLMQAIMAAITDAEEAAAAARMAGLSEDFKQALLDCFENVAWINGDGQTYYDALYDALYPPIHASSITLNKSTIAFNAIGDEETLIATVLPVNATDTVSWSSSDTSVATVDSSGKVTSVAAGTATITATAGSVSASCGVSVALLSSIDVVFTQGGATIYSDDPLDSLKQYLVVTATYSDSSTEVIPAADYTLSGTLTVGTSTITATYSGMSDTFNVTVSQPVTRYAIVNNLTHTSSSNASTNLVEENDRYSTSIGVEVGYTLQSVTVTMGGVDITSTAYNSGTQSISISAVTGNVVITATAIMTPSSISAVFTQGSATIYDTDTLDSLKQYLVVTATYPDSSTETIPSTDYTLSGTLAEGTSTITATYCGKTDTFNVTVSTIPTVTPTVAKKTVFQVGSSGFLETTTAGGAAYCGFRFDGSVSGGTIDITWDTDDHSKLDFMVGVETDTQYDSLRSNTQLKETYGLAANSSGFSTFYWYKYGKYYEDNGSNVTTIYQPNSDTGHCTIEVPSGYKAFMVSVRRNSSSTSANNLPTGNNDVVNWASENVHIKLIGGVA